MKSFITLEEAIEILNNNVKSLEVEEVDLIKGIKRLLAEDVYSKIDNPPFDKSAMDGYSVIASDTLATNAELKVIDEVFAGEVSSKEVVSGTAIKIMTGAPIPKGANAVIKQEDVIFRSGMIEINKSVHVNENICFKGEDIKKGSRLVSKNKKLDYADIGIIASSGMNKIKVYKKPQIAFISSGDEVLDIGETLSRGKIYNSNKYSILSRIEELGYEVVNFHHVEDSSEEIGQWIKQFSRDTDLIITTGGASVGEKDLIKEAIDKINGEKIFWKINIKPGSAILCSKYNNTLIISLSGNPTAALTTFELVVRPTLEKLSGKEKIKIKREKAILLEDLKNSRAKRMYLRGNVSHHEEKQVVSITQIKKGNGILSSTLNSNCLVEIKDGVEDVKAGEIVDIIKI
jgi:molybdopterin molybdotransferase